MRNCQLNKRLTILFIFQDLFVSLEINKQTPRIPNKMKRKLHQLKEFRNENLNKSLIKSKRRRLTKSHCVTFIRFKCFLEFSEIFIFSWIVTTDAQKLDFIESLHRPESEIYSDKFSSTMRHKIFSFSSTSIDSATNMFD
jgi:hypothetical protein